MVHTQFREIEDKSAYYLSRFSGQTKYLRMKLN